MTFVGSTPEHNMFYWVFPEMHDELLELGHCWYDGEWTLGAFPTLKLCTSPILSAGPSLLRLAWSQYAFSFPQSEVCNHNYMGSHSQSIPRNLAIIRTAELPFWLYTEADQQVNGLFYLVSLFVLLAQVHSWMRRIPMDRSGHKICPST